MNEGQEAKFTIKIAGGKPKPTVKWFKEEEEIIVTTVETYEIVEVEDTVTLIIKSAKPDNTGNYYAQLVNEAGQVSSNKALLTVNSTYFELKTLIKHQPLGCCCWNLNECSHILIILNLQEDQSLSRYQSLWRQSTRKSP